MKSYQERQEALLAAIERHPGEFGLRAFPGDTFRVSRSASYWGDDDTPVFYTERKRDDGTWQDFAKGSEAELVRNKRAL